MKHIKLCWIGLLAFTLTSCGYKDQFRCSPARGAYCSSMTQVNEMISNGTIDFLDIDKKKQKKFKLGRLQANQLDTQVQNVE